MSVPNQTAVPTQRPSLEGMSDGELIAFVQHYEPVVAIHPCAGKCGRTVAQGIALCVRCRNVSQHPAFGRRV